MKKILLLTTFTVVLLIGIFIFTFGSALTQEGNPAPILTSIMKLELFNNGYEKISDSHNMVTYVSEKKGKYAFRFTKKFMKDHGWSFKEQIGSGLLFVKNKKVVTIETRQYTKNYYLWKLPKEALK
ncbi:hypothetical protein CVD28_13110 [Bacillus sp. M6-12]|uniref:hypothetical protein n=1 Tax=Bacillus sp. M6-12 TaxID=2054166 RepID=UPI000C785C32|nr:hypothetical protein [Bacillus sp. M6-12]PLS17480.1 hypothetical protein CVD28_13110 [Bacillus sp. M6-12]